MKADDASSRARRGRFSGPSIGLALLGLVAVGLVVASGRSLSKAELTQELMALDKNERMSLVASRAFDADLGDGLESFDLIYSHAPAKGPGAGEDALPVVLVHGTPGTLFSWVEIVNGTAEHAGLAAERDVYTIEVLGHGMAPGSVERFGFERCGRFVSAAIRALGLERVHLVGSSYGGEFVWRAALDDPELVESLVLIDPSGYARRERDWLPEEVEMREHPLAKLGWLLNSRARVERALAPHFDAIPPDRTEELYLVCANATNWSAMVDLARDENGERAAELTSLRPRTLVLWGENDVAYPLEVYGRRFARDIPRAELIVVADSGHYPHEERPAEVLRALDRFFGEPSNDTNPNPEPKRTP